MKAVPAQFDSECEYCGEQINEGDLIAYLDGEWIHAECAEEEGEDVDYD